MTELLDIALANQSATWKMTTKQPTEMTVSQAKAAGLLGAIKKQGQKPHDSASKRELAKLIYLLTNQASWFVREEFRFSPAGQWRADWAIAPLEGFAPEYTWLTEFEGGEFAWKHDQEAGKHQAQRFASDAKKYNESAILGYRLLRFTASMVKSGLAADQLMRAMKT